MAATAAGPRARQLAEAIALQVPDACLPAIGERPAPTIHRTPATSRAIRRVPTWAWVAAVGVIIVTALVVRQWRSTAPATVIVPAQASSPADECPPVNATLRADVDGSGCDEALTFDEGEVSSPAGRFRVGGAGDRAATGRWACGRIATLALLRPDGDVFVADRWAAPDDEVVLRFVGTVPGAIDLSAVDSDGDGCDEVAARAADGRVTNLRPKERG